MKDSDAEDIIEYIKLKDSEEEEKLNTQAQVALNYIMTVEAKLRKHPKVWTYELNYIKKIYSYVLKHKFLPESYQRMLGLWHVRTIKDLRE